jgi:hypothetical protein
MLAGEPQKAAEAYFKGMQRQVSAGFSSDPPLFWYPVRRSYAAALIAAGRSQARARASARLALAAGRTIPLALLALSQAERALGEEDRQPQTSPAPSPSGQRDRAGAALAYLRSKIAAAAFCTSTGGARGRIVQRA